MVPFVLGPKFSQVRLGELPGWMATVLICGPSVVFSLHTRWLHEVSAEWPTSREERVKSLSEVRGSLPGLP